MPVWIGLLLAPMGRVAVAKMLVLPCLLYMFTVLPVVPPRALFTDLPALISDLIWGKERKRVSIVTLQRPMVEGGLGIPDF